MTKLQCLNHKEYCKRYYQEHKEQIKKRKQKYYSEHYIKKGRRKNLTEEHSRKIGLANTGYRNGMWKDDSVGYSGLHLWVRSRLPKPNKCQICNIKPSLDLANITGTYNRDFNNWKWVCRGCHMLSDGRMNNLNRGGRKRQK